MLPVKSATVFVSYAHKDTSKEFLDKLKLKFAEAGLTWWIDEDLRLGDNWRVTIDNAIKQSFVVLVIVTPRARVSEYVIYEWAFAMGTGKKVIPVLLEDIEPEALHPQLAVIQVEKHFRNFLNATEADWDRLMAELQFIQREDDIPLSALRARDMLNSPVDINQIQRAVITLSSIEHPSGIRLLAEAVASLLPQVSVVAALALSRKTGHTDKNALRGLGIALRDDGHNNRNDAVNALVAMNTEEAITYLWNAYDEKENNYSYDALRGLLTIQNPAVIPYLIEVSQRGQNVPHTILDSFIRFRDSRTISEIIAHFHRFPAMNYETRVKMFEALKVCADPDDPAVWDFLVGLARAESRNNHSMEQVFNAIEHVGGKGYLERLEQLPPDHIYNFLSQWINRTKIAIQRKLNKQS